MSELAQIGVSEQNLICLDKLKESGYFDELQEAARFAAVLAIRNKLYIGKDLTYQGSNLKTRWNTSLVDPDYFLRNLVNLLDNKPDDLGVGLRSLIIIGLDYIWTKIEFGGINLGELFTI